MIDLSTAIALSAARIRYNAKLPMADSIILTTARAYGATLWSQDSDLENIGDAKYIIAKK